MLSGMFAPRVRDFRSRRRLLAFRLTEVDRALLIALSELGVSQGRVCLAAVVVAFCVARRERNANLEGLQRHVEATAAKCTGPSRELGPKVLGLEIGSSIELNGGVLGITGRKQGPAERIMFPRRPRWVLGTASSGHAGEVDQAKRLGVRLPLACRDGAWSELSLGLVQHAKGFALRAGLLAFPRKSRTHRRPQDSEIKQVRAEPFRQLLVQARRNLIQ